MALRQVFFSFHYEKDAMRASQIRNMGKVDNSSTFSDNDWESVRKKDDDSIKKWIADQMKMRSCVIVLIGEKTSERKWVRHEIIEAYNSGKGLFGIYIHNLKDPRVGTCSMGANPFDEIRFKDGQKLSSVIKSYDPGIDAYVNIKNNIENWIETAISQRDK